MNDLLAAARAARGNAHAPYSRFPVGAALRTRSGRIFAGCNVENAAYPQGQCAEATAIGAMVTAGERAIVEALVVGGDAELCTPCGGCRQRLAEFAAADVPLHLCGPEGLRQTVSLGELLPLAFSGRSLEQAGRPRAAAWEELVGATADHAPRLALVLGSGLDPVVERVERLFEASYADLPDFPRPTVPGHEGKLVLGRIAGVPLLVLRGRQHLYEGAPAAGVAPWVRRLKALGVRTLLLTNAAGSLRPDWEAGTLVALLDHINLQGTNPLVGPNDDAAGPRFVDLSAVYDPELRAVLTAAGERVGVAVKSGVYLAVLGPCFETPAEIRAYRALGADLVGMSTVPEAIAARHAGLGVAAVSVVTNLAAGLAPAPLSHEETLAGSAGAAGDLARLLEASLPEIARAAG